MSALEETRARLVDELRRVLGLAPDQAVPADRDGDIQVTWGTSVARLRLLEREPPLLSVYSVVLSGVERSAELLEALNDMNAGIVSCRVFWADDSVIAATEVPAGALSRDELEHALWAVGSFADWADTVLQPRFGGTTAGG